MTNPKISEQNLWLQAATTEGQPLNKDLDDFVHILAHNLKNPLGVVISYADYLQKYCINISFEELQEGFDTIWQNGHQMNNIINELLLLVSLRTEEIRPEPLNMARIVADVQSRLAYLINESQAKITVPTEWPPAWGHSLWVEEVWLNYFSNAIKYGGQPPHVELGATIQDEKLVQFWVRDNGCGLPPEKQAQLFKPFTKLEQLRLRGDGLGLSAVRHIVERLGGQVSVESGGLPEQGSIFSFYLPPFDPAGNESINQ